jgi:MoxR-like ATPase
VIIAPPLEDYVISVIAATTPDGAGLNNEFVRTYLRFGPGPRAAQAVVLGAKVNALLDGRAHVRFEDVADTILPALRHRLILNFQAEAENVTAERILEDVTRALARP